MKTGAQVGLAVAAGYVLGRYHKGKWALALAAMGAGKKLPGPQGAILEQGKKLLGSTPVVGHLTEEVRGQLVEAGRTAVMAAASRRIDSFSDALRDRSELMRGTEGNRADRDEPEDEPDDAEDQGEEESGSRPARRQAPQARKAADSGAARKRGSTSTARAKSSEGSPARPRTRASSRTSSSGQESRPRRRTGEGAKQESAATSRRRSRTQSSGQR